MDLMEVDCKVCKVEEIGSGLCPVVGFDINCAEVQVLLPETYIYIYIYFFFDHC